MTPKFRFRDGGQPKAAPATLASYVNDSAPIYVTTLKRDRWRRYPGTFNPINLENNHDQPSNQDGAPTRTADPSLRSLRSDSRHIYGRVSE